MNQNKQTLRTETKHICMHVCMCLDCSDDETKGLTMSNNPKKGTTERKTNNTDTRGIHTHFYWCVSVFFLFVYCYLIVSPPPSKYEKCTAVFQPTVCVPVKKVWGVWIVVKTLKLALDAFLCVDTKLKGLA